MNPQPAHPARSRKPAGAAVLRPDKTDAIVAAFYAELAEGGHERLTMDRVAARAGVGKAALYRRWPSKERMLADLVASIARTDGSPTDHGSLPADLRAYIDDAAGLLSDPLFQRIMPYLIAQARSSPELVQAVRRLPGPSREDGYVILRRAIDRGEISPRTDIDLVLDMIAGPVLMHAIFLARPLGPGYAEQLAAAVLRAAGYTGDGEGTPRDSAG
jgi:AcrR family transcriptional regulator